MKPKDQKLIKVEAPFLDEISGLSIVKILDGNVQNTIMLKLKFTQNLAILDVTNTGLQTVIFHQKEMLGILDLRSMGYYKIKEYYRKIRVSIINLNWLILCVSNLISL